MLGVVLALATLLAMPAGAGASALPTLNVSDATPFPVTEGNAGTTNVSFDITLSESPAANVTVSYATMLGSATANVDYVYKQLSETFLAGATGAGLTKTITVVVNGDTTPESNENFFVQLYSPTGGAVLGDRFGQAVIANDDAAPPGISVSDATPAPVTEGNAGTTPATFNVVLSASPAAPVTYKWATNFGTATAGTDYVYAQGTGTFAAGTGTLSQPVIIQVNGDTTPEGNETFLLQIYDVGGAAITDAYGKATIQNDDAAVPTISIADDTGAEGGNVVIPVTLSASPPTAVSVKFTTMPGAYFDTDATPGTDFTAQAGTLSWAMGRQRRGPHPEHFGAPPRRRRRSQRALLGPDLRPGGRQPGRPALRQGHHQRPTGSQRGHLLRGRQHQARRRGRRPRRAPQVPGHG